MNILCIANLDHQSWSIVVDHSSKFEDINLMLNPLLMGYNTENGATLQKLTDKLLISGKRKKKLLFKIERMVSKKLKVLKNH